MRRMVRSWEVAGYMHAGEGGTVTGHFRARHVRVMQEQATCTI
jgi:hypothetical protein